MRRLIFRTVGVALMLVGVLWGASLQGGTTPEVTFIENKNQWPSTIRYAARVPGGNMLLKPGMFTYTLIDEGKMEALHEASHHDNPEFTGQPDGMVGGHVINVAFAGSNPTASLQPFGQTSAYYNYYIGADSRQWAGEAHGYEGVTYSSLYAGIDMKVYGYGQQVKYDFVVAPYGDPCNIRMTYDGAEAMLVDRGNLYTKTSVGDIIEQKPVAYQVIDGRRVWVSVEFYLMGNAVSFNFPKGYDPCYELVIDPLLIFSTYSGSTADNWGSTATPGERGTLYSGGVTSVISITPQSFPATPGAFQTSSAGLWDVGILKYDSTGTRLLYATYLGGANNESAHSLVVNKDNELIVLGTTSSDNFPTSTGAFDRTFDGGTFDDNVIQYDVGSDIYIARFSPTGSQLLAGTYLGGTSNDGLNPSNGVLVKNYGDELRGDVITDDDNNIYISSVTASADFPGINSFSTVYKGGVTDAILVKLNKEMSTVLWSAFLGGAGDDASHTLQFDKAHNIYIGGGTTSAAIGTTPGAYQPALKGNVDGWIAKVANNGSAIINATYTGTTAFDQVYFIDLNEDDEVYVYGQTSGNFPVSPGVYSNPNSGQFVQKFNSTLTTSLLSTVFGSGGGIPDISPTAFLVNECNNLYMSGWGGDINRFTSGDHWQSTTHGMPVTADAYKRTTSGSDFYFMVLTDDATQFLYGTYLGGNESKTHVDGGTSRFDKGGIVYHAVCSGCASLNTSGGPSSDFPTTPGAWSRVNRSENCNNAAFKFDLSSLKARIQTNSFELDHPGLDVVCIPDKIVFQNLSTGGQTFEWNLGDGTFITKFDTSMVVHQYLNPGKYRVWLKAIDKGTCRVKDSTSVLVTINIAQANVQPDDDLCLNVPYQLKASGGAQYNWRSEDNTFTSTLATPTVNPPDTTTYFVRIVEANGCIHKDTVVLNVIVPIAPNFTIDRSAECFNRPIIAVADSTKDLRDGDRLFFDFGDGVTEEGETVIHEYEQDGLYNVKLVGVREFCVSEKIIPVPVFKLLIPNVITPGRSDNSNDTFTIQYGDTPGATPANYGFKTSVILYNRWGTKVYESDDYQYDWAGEGLAAGVYFYEVTVADHASCKSWLQLIK